MLPHGGDSTDMTDTDTDIPMWILLTKPLNAEICDHGFFTLQFS